MKIRQKLITALAVLFILSNGIPIFAQESDVTAFNEAPAFDADIEYSFQGYVVKGTFCEYTTDISMIETLYSLDGETWLVYGNPWDLHLLSMDDSGEPAKLQRQICLYPGSEPMKSYLAGALDRFYVKLRVTHKNGDTYETEASVIDRGEPQPLPDSLTPAATFAPSMLVCENNPRRYFGRYQLTVCEDAAAGDISALLPDTLPVSIRLAYDKLNAFADCTIDCPVTWKPLSLPRLTAGRSVTVADAAEEIVVPRGTLLNTPMGVFALNEPLAVGEYFITDEVELILNVVAKDAAPTGVLSAENAGLAAAFDLKPSGATAIRAYILSEGNSEWTELPSLPLLEAVNAQPSTAGSGYTFILDGNAAPYRAYLDARAAGDDPAPFWIGLVVEGGTYNGRQLILKWPDTYDHPCELPDITGAGGNEANAGADNRGDSNEAGQRPDLPREPEDKTEPPDTISGGEADTGTIDNDTTKTERPSGGGRTSVDMPKTERQDAPAAPAQPSAAKQSGPGKKEDITNNKNKKSADLSAPDTKTDIMAPYVPTIEKAEIPVQEKPVLTERPLRDTEGASFGLFPAAAAAITVICIAAALARAMAFRRKI